MKTIIFHPLAKQELADAVAYYEAQRSGLGKEYLDEIEDTAALIAQYSEAGAIAKRYDPARCFTQISLFFVVPYFADR
jgi:toxin ParE1/3/4